MVSTLRLCVGLAAACVLVTGCKDRDISRAEERLPTLSIPIKAMPAEPAVEVDVPPRASLHDQDDAIPDVSEDSPKVASTRVDRRGSRRRAKAASVTSAKTAPKGAEAKDAEVEESSRVRLGVARLTMAEGIKGREPQSPGASFRAAKGASVYAFVDITNKDKRETTITVSIGRDGAGSQAIPLEIGASKRFRTWAKVRTTGAGNYTTVVRDAGGRVLARTSFEVTP